MRRRPSGGAGTVAVTIALALGAPAAMRADDRGRVETALRGIEHREELLQDYCALASEKEFMAPQELSTYMRAAGSWGDPDKIGFHIDNLTGRSLSVVSVRRKGHAWRAERFACVFCGIDTWGLYGLGGSARWQPPFAVHSVVASDGQHIASWTNPRNTARLTQQDRETGTSITRFETGLVQTGLFRAEYLRSGMEGHQFRLVARERLEDADCWVLQRRASRVTPDPNRYTRIWVAPERSFAVLRWEDLRFSLADGHEEAVAKGVSQPLGLDSWWEPILNYLYTSSELREVSPGFWMPHRTTCYTEFPAEHGAGHTYGVRMLELSDLQVRPTVLPLYQQVPLGARVNDFAQKRLYPNGWEEQDVRDFLAEANPPPPEIRPLPTFKGDHAPTEP